MRVFLSFSTVFGLMLTMSACSSSSSGGDNTANNTAGSGGGTAQTGTAPEKCRAFLDAVCSRMVDCLLQAGEITEADRQTTDSGCHTELDQVITCDKAVSVSASYPTCMNDVPSIQCAAVVDAFNGGDAEWLPTSCNQVILR